MSKTDTLSNYTTGIAVEKTVGEIVGLLFQKDAKHVSVEKDGAGAPKSILFSFPFPGIVNQFISYKIESNWQGALEAMKKKKGVSGSYCNEAQARRTSWRTICYWIEHQIAMCEMAQGQLEQMFFSHALNTDSGKYVAFELMEFKRKQIGAGNDGK